MSGAVALGLILGGVPIALSRLGWPLPRRIPALAELRDGLLQAPLSWSVVVRVMATAVWVAWGMFALAVAAEAYGWVRGIEAARVPWSGPLQSWACSLVASAVLILPSMPQLAVPPASIPMTIAVRERAPIQAMSTTAVTANGEAKGERAADTATGAYVVQRHDCLWNIAEQYLGDGFRYREIVDLNRGTVQPDGRRLGDPHWIYPGWLLELPPDAAGLPETRAPLVVDEEVPLPSVAAPAPVEPRDVPPDVTPTTSLAPLPVPDASRAPAPSAPSVSRPVATPAPTTIAGPQLRSVEPSPERVRNANRSWIAAGVGATGLLAGIVIWRLDRLRLAQHRRRRRGRDLIRPDPSLERVELKARAIGETEAARWVDLTLRYAWSALAEAGGAGVESIVCVRPGALGMEIVVDPPAAPVSRFILGPDGHTWRLDPDIDLDELSALAEGQSPLVPALVTVGSTADGPLLIDMETAGVLAVNGDEQRVDAFLAARALELATAPWAGDTPLYLLGGDTRLAALDEVRVVDDPEGFVDRLPGVTTLRGTEIDRPTTLAARVSPENVEAWEPTALVAARGALSSAALSDLACRATPGRAGLVLIASGSPPEATWRLLIGSDGQAVLEPLGIVVDASVDMGIVDGMAALLGAASDDADIAPVIALKSHEAEPDVDFDGEVRVLGPVEVTWASGGTGGRVDRANLLASLVAYLGTHDERPVPAQRLQSALWPLREDHPRFGEVKDGTLRTTVSRARRALGLDSTGAPHLPDARGGAYRLGPRFSCDWRRFRRLATAARTAPSAEAIELLREALALVRGRPFEDAPPTFGWAEAEQLVSHMEVRIAEAAEDLAERAREAGDPGLAAWAADQGLRTLPTREALYRVKMQAAFDAGDPDGIEQAYREARRAAALIDPFEQVQEETERLYQRLRRSSRVASN